MVTNCPQEIAAPRVDATTAASLSGRTFSRVWKRVQFALCSLHGHDPLLHFEENRMFLRCASCGYESPGWDLDQRRPRVRFHGDHQQHFVERPQSFERTERRIA